MIETFSVGKNRENNDFASFGIFNLQSYIMYPFKTFGEYMEEKEKFVWYKGDKYSLRDGYYISTSRLHRRIWQDHFGEIPEGHHIHHRNGDGTDNRIENLECIDKKSHHKMHFNWEERKKILHSPEIKERAHQWHRSEKGRKRHSRTAREMWDNRRSIQVCCVICHQLFQTMNYAGTKYCGQRCRSKAQYLRDQIQVSCIICGKLFNTFKKKNHAQACSPLCGAQLSSLTKKERKNDVISSVKR